VLAALNEIKSGEKVSVAQARPYGCSVKYASWMDRKSQDWRA